jgi:hypothetical protein
MPAGSLRLTNSPEAAKDRPPPIYGGLPAQRQARLGEGAPLNLNRRNDKGGVKGYAGGQAVPV